jgi:flavin-dependent dehydrogenase
MTNDPSQEVMTRRDPWDVIIIGGGPAGAIAALQLARRHRHVLLVEKSRWPRFKVCGGCLGGAALELLKELGLEDLAQNAGAVRLRRLRLSCDGAVAELQLAHRMGLSRTVFDAALLDAAVEAGAEVCFETTGRLQPCIHPGFRSVELTCVGQKVEAKAKAVLLATGLSCGAPEFVTRPWSNSRVGVGMLIEARGLDLARDVLYMACAESGYVGMAPVEAGRFIVAAAIDAAALDAASSPGEVVRVILEQAGIPVHAELGAAVWRGTPLLTRQTRPLATHRCLLIGDTAEYAEPFTGEGIGWAMRSAVLASSVVHEGLHDWNEQIGQRWENLYARNFAYRQRRCRVITRYLLRNQFARALTVWSLRHAPFLASSFS